MKNGWLKFIAFFQLVLLVLVLIALFKGSKQPSVIVGPPGKDGYTPVKGIDYRDGIDGRSIVGPKGNDGKDGQNATPEQIAQAVAEYCANGNCKGEKGNQGEPGASGREIELRYNQSKERWEYRYVGDDAWQPVETH